MNPNDVKALIDQLLKTGEVLATKAFELALRQVYVEVAQNLVMVILSIVLAIIGGKIYKKAQDSDYVDFWNGTEPLAGILWIFSAAGIFIGLTSLISRLINPEWYAVKILLSTFVGN